MSMIETVYTATLHATRGVLPLLAVGDGKLARGIRGRRGACERLERWAETGRDPSRPLVWFHAPSVGEGLQARAVIEALREIRPEVQVVYTYFSPSAVAFAGRAPVDASEYLPLDLPKTMRRLIDALRPDAIAFTKTEVWPNLTRAAEANGIPMVLLSATLPATSSRTGWAARSLLGPAHERLAAIAAISPDDARRFSILAASDRITVMGDARFDQVWNRIRRPHADPELLASLEDDRLTLVAGSTWPADENPLIRAFSAATASDPIGCRLILVPHEPSEGHLGRTEEDIRSIGLSYVRLSGVERGGSEATVLLVDRVGILGDLYRLADIAYVGGGFGNAGLHSVLEPAAFGVPILFGPRHANAREAGDLIREGAARSVESAGDLATALGDWIASPDRRRTAGDRARRYVEQHLGAARRGAEVIARLIETRVPVGR